MSSGNWIVDNLMSALETWNKALSEILSLLTQSPENFRGGGIWNVIVGINGSLQAVGYALLVLFFCMGVFKTASNLAELKRPEAAFKMLIRFALAKTAITYCMDILVALYKIAQGILVSVAGSLGALGSTGAVLPPEIITAVEGVGFLESVPLWIVTIFGSLFITVLAFFMLITVYGRFFRLFMMTAIAPLPISAFAGEGTSHFGTSFLKSYASVCLEGVIIVLACVIFSVFASSNPENLIDTSIAPSVIVWNYIIELVFNLLVLVGTVKTAERLTKEMLGL